MSKLWKLYIAIRILWVAHMDMGGTYSEKIGLVDAPNMGQHGAEWQIQGKQVRSLQMHANPLARWEYCWRSTPTWHLDIVFPFAPDTRRYASTCAYIWAYAYEDVRGLHLNLRGTSLGRRFPKLTFNESPSIIILWWTGAGRGFDHGSITLLGRHELNLVAFQEWPWGRRRERMASMYMTWLHAFGWH